MLKQFFAEELILELLLGQLVITAKGLYSYWLIGANTILKNPTNLRAEVLTRFFVLVTFDFS